MIRVKSDVQIKPATGNAFLLRSFGKELTEAVPVWFEDITYRSDGRVTGINLVAVVAKPQVGKEPDPWFLVTNLRKPETTIKRFQIEEWFKDLKHRLGLSSMQTKNLKRVRSMVCLSVVSYGITMLIGTAADKLKTVKDSLITGSKKTGSRVWFAIQIVKHKLLGKTFWRKVYHLGAAP